MRICSSWTSHVRALSCKSWSQSSEWCIRTVTEWVSAVPTSWCVHFSSCSVSHCSNLWTICRLRKCIRFVSVHGNTHTTVWVLHSVMLKSYQWYSSSRLFLQIPKWQIWYRSECGNGNQFDMAYTDHCSRFTSTDPLPLGHIHSDYEADRSSPFHLRTGVHWYNSSTATVWAQTIQPTGAGTLFFVI